MKVSQILKSKASASVVMVKPGVAVGEAVALLAEHKIGTVLVSEDGEQPSGILSERDIVREMATQGADILARPVSALMTQKLVTCGQDDSADEVMRKMTDGRFRHMPVLEQSKLVGLISLGDVVKARLTELAMEKDALEGMIMGH